jgi:hypothetical protein
MIYNCTKKELIFRNNKLLKIFGNDSIKILQIQL